MKNYVRKPVNKVIEKKNAFLENTTRKNTFTENGAISHSSTGNEFVDDFANSGAYRMRPTDEVFASAFILFSINPKMAMQLFLYLRLITRKIKGFFVSEKVQRGQGNRDESLRRLLWVAYNYPSVFYKNLWLIPLVGSFKDLWILMAIDFRGELDKNEFFELMKLGLENKYLKPLVIKYMPQIKATSKCTTNLSTVKNEDAKEFAKFLGLSYKEYRKFKSSNGEAHRWQQKISKGYFDQINFNNIPGKALSLLVNGNFLKNNKLEKKFEEWIDNQPVAKFTGYVYELFMAAKKVTKTYKLKTINKQFDGLIELAKKDNGGITGNVWCALDTSASMMWEGLNQNGVTAYDICLSLGIYFSELSTGAFHNHVIMFDRRSRVRTLHGTFTEKVNQLISSSAAMGSTNFQSVIDEIVRIRRQNPEIPTEDYPTTLLVVSDMQFNPTKTTETNYEMAMRKLEEVGLPRISIVWWQVTGRTSDFPSRVDDPGTYVISGFDGAIISLLLGGQKKESKPKSMEELMYEALNQEILAQVKI